MAKSSYVPMDAIYSDAPEAPPASVGESLRRARAKLGWTLDSAAARTRIRRDYLEALESMDPRGLPSRAYAIGYLRTYAGVLGLDVAATVERFKHEVETETGRAQPTAPQRRREIRLPKGVVGAVIILGVVFAAASWYGARVTEAGAFTDAPSPADGVLSAPPPLVETAGREVTLADVWGGLPSPRAGDWLVLSAQVPTYLEVRDASGRILFARDLAPGEAYRAPEESGLTLSTENAGAIEVRAGERVIGPLGAPGEMLENVSATDFLLEAMTGEAEAGTAGAGQ
ncbi:helix-turn-helix domain-containing protein [Marinicauda algicola]|nr:helix-turn-helix domain-containing protein [Marinicauda algicola]